MRTGIGLNMTNHQISMEGTIEQVVQNGIVLKTQDIFYYFIIIDRKQF